MKGSENNKQLPLT